MSEINWNIVDRNVFAEFRLATLEEIAVAYIAEAYKDNEDNARLITLFEMGQGRYSNHYNSKLSRHALFSNLVSRLDAERKEAERETSKVGA